MGIVGSLAGIPIGGGPLEFECDVCDARAPGEYVPRGWYGYPAGWLLAVSDAEGIVLVCSRACAGKSDARGNG